MNCPVYPPPLKKKSSLFGIFFKWRHSWLHVLYERSYRMKMGHWKLPGHEVFMPNQPALVRWNVARLAETLLAVIDEDADAALAAASGVIDAMRAQLAV